MELSEMSREERTAHVDLMSPCQIDKSKHHYRNALIDFTGIKPDRTWLACHLCQNDSQSDKPCRNPLHIYWGTKTENLTDVCPITGLTPGQKIKAKTQGITVLDKTRQKMSAVQKEVQKEVQNRPDVKAKKSAALKEAWNRPDVKAKQSAAMNRPEVKAKKSAALKEVLNRPEVKAKQSAALKEAWIRRKAKKHASVTKSADTTSCTAVERTSPL
jgi:hypothetical protein